MRRVVTPSYNADFRVLTFAGRVVKEFRQPSRAQELLLITFQEQSWEPRIDDPLPPAPGVDAKKRLSATVYRLNRHQKNRLITFGCDGTGTGVTWRPSAAGAEGEQRESRGRAKGDKPKR
jgi:hypothetical protein